MSQYQSPNTAASLPQPAIENPRHGPPEPIDGGFLRLLETCFHPDEFVAIAPAAENEDGEIVPRSGVTLTAAEWKSKVETKGGIDKLFSTRHGLFLRINPMIRDGFKNADVTSFRHALVEFNRDEAGNRIPKADQYQAILASGMPVSALIDSGGMSLHAWIRVDAPNEIEYKRRVAIVWKWFAGKNLDSQNRHPSRLSRCPDGRRTVDGEVRHQRLLATGFGAASWGAWEAGNSDLDKPPFVDLAQIIAGDCEPERPTVADVGIGSGMLYAGRINEIHGEPGTGKSNVAIALSNAVMRDGGTVIYIDPEDNPRGFTRRALQLGAAAEDLIDRCKYLHNPTPDEILSAQRWAAHHHPQLVVLDGLAESMAAEGLVEDKAGDVLTFFRDRLRPFAEMAGAAVLVSDHVAKSTEDRGRWSRGSGAKLGRYDGVSYNLSLVEAYSPRRAGAVRLTIAKDRNGGSGPTGHDIAEVHFAPGDGNLTMVTFRSPKQQGPFRPDAVIVRIVSHLDEQGEATKRELRSLGKSQAVDQAIRQLTEEGRILYVKRGCSHVYSLKAKCTYRLGKKAS
jgi:hypothetical protein